MIDIKLKLRPGHATDVDWMASSSLWQIFWNVTSACNFRCKVCFSDSGRPAPDELTTQEAKKMLRSAHAAGVTDVVISGGEPFMRKDLIELLAYMADRDISARIASNGSLVTGDILDRLRRETLTKSFQISLDTLDPAVYSEVHGVPGKMLDTALGALRAIQDHGFHTTVSVRLTPTTLAGIPALMDRAVQEGWATVTVHCPLHTGRAEGAWTQQTDVLSLLEPAFEHFLGLPEHWVVETTLPWARYHPVMQRLSERVRVVHAGCGGGRCRLAIGASGSVTPCICIDLPAARMGNVRLDDLGVVFRESPIADMMRRPQEHGICVDCEYVATCGGGCRGAALVLTGRLDGLDISCPVRRTRNAEAAHTDGTS